MHISSQGNRHIYRVVLSIPYRDSTTGMLKKAVCKMIYNRISLSWERILFHISPQILTLLLLAQRVKNLEGKKKTERVNQKQ